jgi:hypothetical protein
MRLLLTFAALAVPVFCMAKSPPCSSWPTNMALTVLKNAGITDPTKLDESKTSAVQVASENIGKGLYKQVYDITFHEKTGRAIEVITSGKASWNECSMSSVDVYIVFRKFNSDGDIQTVHPKPFP